ncbi:MAG: HAD family hydrolase [Anaerolineae bacterium]
MSATASPAHLRGRTIAAVFFDLDGTLVETDDATVSSLARRLQPLRAYLPALNVPIAARDLANWLNDQFNAIIALLDQWALDTPVQRWLRRVELIEKNGAQHPFVPVPGTVELLRALAERYPLAIVSTRTVAEIAAYLRQEKLADVVAVVIGSDSTERIKPHPQPILRAAEVLRVDPRQALMVGDTTADVRAAQAAGALAVGVLCGFGDRVDLHHADLIVASTADIAAWL